MQRRDRGSTACANRRGAVAHAVGCRHAICTPYSGSDAVELKPDPKKPALGIDPRVETGFGKRSCSNKEVERDDDSKKNHPALAICFATSYHDPHPGSSVVEVRFCADRANP